MSQRTQQLNALLNCNLEQMVMQGNLAALSNVLDRVFDGQQITNDVFVTPMQCAEHLLAMSIHHNQGGVAHIVLQKAGPDLRPERSIELAAQYGALNVLDVLLGVVDLTIAPEELHRSSVGVHLDLALESAAEMGHLDCLDRILDLGTDPWKSGNLGMTKAIIKNYVPIVQRLMQCPGFEHYHMESLSMAATRPDTSNEMIDVLFDLDMAQKLLNAPENCFSPQSTNVYFLDLYRIKYAENTHDVLQQQLQHSGRDGRRSKI